jgi:Fic family protein
VRKNKVTAALGYDWMLERRHVNMTREQALRQIRSDYLELPDLTLTPAQAARLWSLREETAASLLEELASRRFLTRAKGSYVRRLRTERRF